VIDTHAHVHDAKFDADRSETIARARAVGVEQIVLVGCDLADTERAIQCAREFSLHASIGIHPHEAAQAPEDIVERFDALYDSKHVVAIGEIGLDYFYTHSPPDVQQRILREQLAYASTHRLPTIFHQRDAFEDFIGILREAYDPTYGGVVHCFTGDSVQASQLVDEFGLRLGIGGVLTFKNAQPLRDAVRKVGIDALVLETDCPYLAPMPLRGERNEPAYIAHTARRLATELALGLDETLARTDATARALFPALVSTS